MRMLVYYESRGEYTTVPIHDCALTLLYPNTTVPLHNCAHTLLWALTQLCANTTMPLI